MKTKNIDNKSYELTECETPSERCKMCALANPKGLPCMHDDGTYGNGEWTQQICAKTVPSNCYLKPV